MPDNEWCWSWLEPTTPFFFSRDQKYVSHTVLFELENTVWDEQFTIQVYV